MIHALANNVTVSLGAGWSRSQERMPCARVLWDSLHGSRPNAAAQRDDGLAHPQRRALQDRQLRGDLEQPSRMGGHGGFCPA